MESFFSNNEIDLLSIKLNEEVALAAAVLATAALVCAGKGVGKAALAVADDIGTGISRLSRNSSRSLAPEVFDFGKIRGTPLKVAQDTQPAFGMGRTAVKESLAGAGKSQSAQLEQLSTTVRLGDVPGMQFGSNVHQIEPRYLDFLSRFKLPVDGVKAYGDRINLHFNGWGKQFVIQNLNNPERINPIKILNRAVESVNTGDKGVTSVVLKMGAKSEPIKLSGDNIRAFEFLAGH